MRETIRKGGVKDAGKREPGVGGSERSRDAVGRAPSEQ